jgi:thioredoxin-like negative regulator of GroEL
MAASDLASKAKEAFVDDDFELAAELYTQAIDAGPATAELYADRAQAHIKLGNYTGACPRALPRLPLAARASPVRFDSIVSSSSRCRVGTT